MPGGGRRARTLFTTQTFRCCAGNEVFGGFSSNRIVKWQCGVNRKTRRELWSPPTRPAKADTSSGSTIIRLPHEADSLFRVLSHNSCLET